MQQLFKNSVSVFAALLLVLLAPVWAEASSSSTSSASSQTDSATAASSSPAAVVVVNQSDNTPPEVKRVQKKTGVVPASGKVAVTPGSTQVHPQSVGKAGISRNTVYPGSLRDNVERIAAGYGWSEVVWSAPYDFNWVGQTNIHANSLSGMLAQLLKDYPLQAVFYRGNHVLLITPRTLK